MVVLVQGGAEVASWPLPRPDRTDLAVADDLARLHLAARRFGLHVRLRDAWFELAELLELIGLRDVVIEVGLGEVIGEAERGEQGGVEEIVVPDDPVA